MIQRLLHRDVGELRLRRVQEWAARSREPYAADLVHLASAEALMHGIVLAVDGQQGLALAAGFSGDELSGGDQALFVGEADSLAGFHGFAGGFEPSHTDDGAHDKIRIRVCGDTDGSSSAMRYFNIADTCVIQPNSKIVRMGFGNNRASSRTPALRLLESKVKVTPGCEGDNLKAV